jgi:hypothetical protein
MVTSSSHKSSWAPECIQFGLYLRDLSSSGSLAGNSRFRRLDEFPVSTTPVTIAQNDLQAGTCRLFQHNLPYQAIANKESPQTQSKCCKKEPKRTLPKREYPPGCLSGQPPDVKGKRQQCEAALFREVRDGSCTTAFSVSACAFFLDGKKEMKNPHPKLEGFCRFRGASRCQVTTFSDC